MAGGRIGLPLLLLCSGRRGSTLLMCGGSGPVTLYGDLLLHILLDDPSVKEWPSYLSVIAAYCVGEVGVIVISVEGVRGGVRELVGAVINKEGGHDQGDTEER
jgi:hypothetical protein